MHRTIYTDRNHTDRTSPRTRALFYTVASVAYLVVLTLVHIWARG